MTRDPLNQKGGCIIVAFAPCARRRDRRKWLLLQSSNMSAMQMKDICLKLVRVRFSYIGLPEVGM